MWETIAADAAAESRLWAEALLSEPERRGEPVFSPLAPEELRLGLETIYEGYLAHYGTSRLFAPGDQDTALLLGDYLYAHGLVRVAESGNVAAVSDLAELISLCAQGRGAKDARTDATETRLRGSRPRRTWAGAGSRTRATRSGCTATPVRWSRRHGRLPATNRSTRHWPRTPASWGKVAAMAASFGALLAKTAAEEGRDIVLGMLIVGLVFLAVIGLGGLNSWLGHRRSRARH